MKHFKFNIEVDKLIRAVEERPPLYHKNIVWDLPRRSKLWREVAASVFEGKWETMSPDKKSNAVLEIQNRWKSLRTSFRREVKQQMKGVKKLRKYIYFKQLQFLMPHIEVRTVDKNVTEERESSSNEDDNSMHGSSIAGAETNKSKDRENIDEVDKTKPLSEDASECNPSESKFEVNVEKLIEAVRERPALYEKDLALDRHSRTNLWREVASFVYEGTWQTMNHDQQDKAVFILQSRWKNIKACLKRELNLRKKGVPRKRKYIYFKLLKFFIDYKKRQATENKTLSSEDEEQNVSEDNESMYRSSIDDTEPNRLEDFGEDFEKVKKCKLRQAVLEGDEQTSGSDTESEHVRFEFDVGKLIQAIKERPALYDRDIAVDRNNRMKLWRQIASIVFEDTWETMNAVKKTKAVDELKTRWKSLQACMRREVNLQRKGAPRRRGREYIYFKQLQFLLPHRDKRNAENNDMSSADEDQNASEDNESIYESSIDGTEPNRLEDFDKDVEKSNDKSKLKQALSKGGEGTSGTHNKSTHVQIQCDVEKLIQAVKERPALYDRDITSDSKSRAKLWRQVTSLVLGDTWESMNRDQQSVAVLDVQSRWQNLRACVSRDERYRRIGKKKRKYIYYKKLEFLIPHIETLKKIKFNDTREGTDTSDQDDEPDEIAFEDYDSIHGSPIDGVEVNQLDGEKFEEVDMKNEPIFMIEDAMGSQNTSTMNEMMNTDPDMNFALSLVPLLKNVPMRRKLDAQIALLTTLKSFSKFSD